MIIQRFVCWVHSICVVVWVGGYTRKVEVVVGKLEKLLVVCTVVSWLGVCVVEGAL